MLGVGCCSSMFSSPTHSSTTAWIDHMGSAGPGTLGPATATRFLTNRSISTAPQVSLMNRTKLRDESDILSGWTRKATRSTYRASRKPGIARRDSASKAGRLIADCSGAGARDLLGVPSGSAMHILVVSRIGSHCSSFIMGIRVDVAGAAQNDKCS